MNEANRWFKTARIFALESWWPPFWPHLEVDWDRALSTMKRFGFDTLQVNALTKWACYPTDLVVRHPELDDRDLVREGLDFCDKHGFKSILYTLFAHAMPVSAQESKNLPGLYEPMFPCETFSEAHRRTVPEKYRHLFTRFHFGDERYVAACIFSASDWMHAMIDELVSRYEYDACWLDGSRGYDGWITEPVWNLCTCPTCRDAYRLDFGEDMPTFDQPDDPGLIPLQRWNHARIRDLLKDIVGTFSHGRAKPIIGNMAFGAGTSWFCPDVLNQLDGGLLEHAADRYELTRKVCEARELMEFAVMYPDCYDPWPRRVTSGWEVENKGLSILSCDGTPYLAQPGKYYYDETRDEPAARIFNFMAAHRDLLDVQKPYAYAGIVTGPVITPPDNLETEEQCIRGWTSALSDTHVPFSVMPSILLDRPERLAELPVLIVPDLAVMSENDIRALYAYAEQGGGLLLTGDPAVWDDTLGTASGSALVDLFDLHRREADDLPEDHLLRRFCFETEQLGGQTYELYSKNRDTDTDGFPLPYPTIHPSHLGVTYPGATWTVRSDAFAHDREELYMPLLATRTIGKGRVCFSTSTWGRQYEERRDPALAEWMRTLTQWLANKPMPVTAQAPRDVQMGLTQLPEGWLVYLINQSNDIQNRRLSPGEMMKVCDRPRAVGEVTLELPGEWQFETLYGPEPDDASATTVQYESFTEHAVLTAIRK